MSEEREQEVAARSAADVAAMLIELGRAVKACHFYASDHPARKATLERSFRAFESALARAGALELDVSAGALHVAGSDPIGRGSLDELVRALIERGVRRLRFEPGLEHDAFVQLVAVLTLDPDELVDAGGVQGALATAGAGVRVNEPSAEEAAVADVAVPSPAPAELAAGDDADLPAPKVQTTDADPLTQLDGLLHDKTTEMEDGTLAPEVAPEPGADLVACLRSLDECRDEPRYAELLQRVAAALDELRGASAGDEPYRAILCSPPTRWRAAAASVSGCWPRRRSSTWRPARGSPTWCCAPAPAARPGACAPRRSCCTWAPTRSRICWTRCWPQTIPSGEAG